jgi:hypothetical protein
MNRRGGPNYHFLEGGLGASVVLALVLALASAVAVTTAALRRSAAAFLALALAWVFGRVRLEQKLL